MSFWFLNGLRQGIRTTRYPRGPEPAPGVTPGRPVPTNFATAEEAALAADNCPVNAIMESNQPGNHGTDVDLGTCIHCERCHFGVRNPLDWTNDYEWARVAAARRSWQPLPADFARSLHVMVVDAGDCGACLREVKQLNNPLYNFHRLGMFFTATPRSADVLVVVGPVSENMRGPLLKTYEAMPDPKKVISVGTCAITGGVFGRTFATAGGVGKVLPVDLEIPGNPPPPLAILHGLLVITGRKDPPPGLRQ